MTVGPGDVADPPEPAAADPLASARPSAAARRPGVVAVLAAATRWTLARPATWPIALVAFLARGGVLVVALPFLVLPTPIGIAAWIGADAVTADGPAARLLVLAAAAAVVAGGLVVVGTVAAAAADRAVLADWAADAAVGSPASRTRGTAATVGRIVAVRAVAAIPAAIAIAWAVPRLADAVYRQLTLPDDLATPLVLRVLVMAPEAVVAVALGILVGELLAGPATVHVAAEGDGALQALARVPRDLVRRAVPVLGAFLVGLLLLAVGLVVPLVAGVAAWDLARRALTAGSDPLAAVAGVAAFVAALVLALVAAGAVAAWRRAATAGAVVGPAPDRTRDDPAATTGATGKAGPAASVPDVSGGPAAG
jgi:hypothetical protein